MNLFSWTKKHTRKATHLIHRGHKLFKEGKKTRSAINTLLIAIAIILIWRGIRGLADKYLFPEYEVLSLLTCLVIGLFILYLDDKKFEELSK